MPTVELFGMLRLKAGVGEVEVCAGNVADALAETEKRYPELRGLLLREGRLAPAHLVSVNGKDFVDQIDRPLAQEDALLVIAADPGG